ncbi:hypothetical protein CYMTET_33566 [Cymbomonas tetramitiformis]|uniref:Exostosin GT47 domain-containing protein n=1 Tax=Cymbomonas tetramitiformis TaxID=36881 RepID=A0AAE0KQU0_9CHLO|nr:hypothetical protein CYMTET_33566 [Cymbomonas tetramitiformis]
MRGSTFGICLRAVLTLRLQQCVFGAKPSRHIFPSEPTTPEYISKVSQCQECALQGGTCDPSGLCYCSPFAEWHGCVKPTWETHLDKSTDKPWTINKTHGDLNCVNRCSRRGACHDGFCACHNDSHGVDCSAPLMWEPYCSPKVYVYDLPPWFNSWSRRSGGRVLPNKLLSRFLASCHRTSDPEFADYFYVPIVTNGVFMDDRSSLLIVRGLQWIQRTYPYWGRSNGSDHLLFNEYDDGWCRLAGHPAVKGAILLSHFGLTTLTQSGWFSSCDQGRLWQWHLNTADFHGDRDSVPHISGAFVPGKDIVLPDDQDYKLKGMSVFLQALQKSQEDARPIARNAFFAGNLKSDCGWICVRQAINSTFRNRPGFIINPSGRTDGRTSAVNVWGDHANNATFCFAPSGAGWGRYVTLSVIFGCIPIIVTRDSELLYPFEREGVDYSLFAIHVEKKDLPTLDLTLRSLSDQDIRHMRANLRKVVSYFLWGSIYGALGEENSFQDAFFKLMEVLARRKGIVHRPHHGLVSRCASRWSLLKDTPGWLKECHQPGDYALIRSHLDPTFICHLDPAPC